MSLVVTALRYPQATSRRPLASRVRRPTSQPRRARASTTRPPYIRESPCWMAFDAGGDLFRYQFDRHAARSETLDRELHYAMACG